MIPTLKYSSSSLTFCILLPSKRKKNWNNIVQRREHNVVSLNFIFLMYALIFIFNKLLLMGSFVSIYSATFVLFFNVLSLDFVDSHIYILLLLLFFQASYVKNWKNHVYLFFIKWLIFYFTYASNIFFQISYFNSLLNTPS